MLQRKRSGQCAASDEAWCAGAALLNQPQLHAWGMARGVLRPQGLQRLHSRKVGAPHRMGASAGMPGVDAACCKQSHAAASLTSTYCVWYESTISSRLPTCVTRGGATKPLGKQVCKGMGLEAMQVVLLGSYLAPVATACARACCPGL